MAEPTPTGADVPVDPALFAVFLVAVLVICVTPGPDMAYVLAHALSQGVLAGVVASLGMAVGMVVHTAAATLGLAALLQTAPLAYDVIRYAGAAYLVYIGVRAWLDGGGGHEVGAAACRCGPCCGARPSPTCSTPRSCCSTWRSCRSSSSLPAATPPHSSSSWARCSW
ncbi:MAG: hypothetical protein GEU94_06655 [Micromonosporaceae bacterium]|nr:hypothetical protein [Micromonosporaceae bacterium]